MVQTEICHAYGGGGQGLASFRGGNRTVLGGVQENRAGQKQRGPLLPWLIQKKGGMIAGKQILLQNQYDGKGWLKNE